MEHHRQHCVQLKTAATRATSALTGVTRRKTVNKSSVPTAAIGEVNVTAVIFWDNEGVVRPAAHLPIHLVINLAVNVKIKKSTNK
jgi:hypothetical protein